MSKEELERIKSTLYWALYYFERNGGATYYAEDINQAREWLKNVLGFAERIPRQDKK